MEKKKKHKMIQHHINYTARLVESGVGRKSNIIATGLAREEKVHYFFLKNFDEDSRSKGGISLLRKVPDLGSWVSEELRWRERGET